MNYDKNIKRICAIILTLSMIITNGAVSNAAESVSFFVQGKNSAVENVTDSEGAQGQASSAEEKDRTEGTEETAYYASTDSAVAFESELESEGKEADATTDSDVLSEDASEGISEDTVAQEGQSSEGSTSGEQAASTDFSISSEGATEGLTAEIAAVVEPTEETMLVSEGEDYTVRVIFSEEAAIPDKTSLEVEEFPEGTKEYDELREVLVETLSNEEKYSNAINLSNEEKYSNTKNLSDEERFSYDETPVEIDSFEKNAKSKSAVVNDTEDKESLEEEVYEERESEETEAVSNVTTVTVYPSEEPAKQGEYEQDGYEFEFLRHFDISFVTEEGVEIEPSASVRVEIEFHGIQVENELSVLHQAKEGIEIFTGENAETTLQEKPETSTVTIEMDSFSNVTVYIGGQYSWMSYTVDVDPTNGGEKMYKGANTNASYALTYYNGQMTLPTAEQVIAPQDYLVDRNDAGKGGYKLNGWVDRNTRQWYAPGAAVQISGNSAFYADWILNDYDVGGASGVSSASIDTSAFITTHVFDYNDLFNLPYSQLQTNGWNLQNSSTLAFFDGTDANRTLARLGNRGTNATNHEGAAGTTTYYANGITTQGIGSDYWLDQFFGTGNAWNNVQSAGSVTNNIDGVMGKTYVGTGNYLYSYNPDSGYYYYDSARNAASYNKSQERFYVYDRTEMATPSVGKDNSDFLPFNNGANVYTSDNNNAQANYWFGMSSEIDFFLPNDPGSNENGNYGNQSITGSDMIYKFSGDDDVWIYVDGELVLDLGGIHNVVYGEINFSTGRCKIVQARGENTGQGGVLGYANGVLEYVSGGSGNVEFDLPSSIKAGDHKLTMYYLERGASQSNAAIYFNIAPRYGLEIIKQDTSDPSNIQLLPDAEFSIYRDEECYIPASLWDSKDSCDNGSPSKNVFTTGNDGYLYCYGLIAGYTYYVKETGVPPHYTVESDQPMELRLDNTGRATISLNGNVATMTQDDSTKTIHMFVDNTPGASVEVEKKWFDLDGSPLAEEDIPETITVHLYRWKPQPDTGGSGDDPNTTQPELPDVKVPVNFSTRYFDSTPSGYSNGHNSDNGYNKTGDLKRSMTVQYGSTLGFTLNGTGGTAGIYSVTVNGRKLYPVSQSNRSTENCYIGGNWGNYPYRTETYVVENVTDSLNVQIQLIGYLGYEGAAPLVSKTMELTTEVTEPSLPEPDPEPDPEQPAIVVPSYKPEDAELLDTQILSGESDWKYVWRDLDSEYYYYVEEDSDSLSYNFDVFYSGNGINNGTITVVNIKNADLYELPATGSGGTYPITALGVFIFTVATLFKRRYAK